MSKESGPTKFEEISHERWKSEAEKSLRGAPFEKALVSTTADGVRVEPLYPNADVPAAAPDVAGVPGAMPYTRGNSAVPSPNGWSIRQEFTNSDPAECNARILEDLSRGVDAIELRLAASSRGAGTAPGIEAADLAGFSTLLDGVMFEMIGTHCDAGAAAHVPAAALAALQGPAGLGTSTGSFGMDPLGALASDGSLPFSLERAWTLAADLTRWCADNAPEFRALRASGLPFHNAGATEAWELALAVANGIEMLRQLTRAEITLHDATDAIEFAFASGRDFFVTIAKLRAARTLWARVVEAAGGDDGHAKMQMFVRSSERNRSVRDAWVNMLRGSSETLAAAIGGADSVCTGSWDEAARAPEAFGRRVARNTQLILQSESHIGRVVDPAGGSEYVEHLTAELAKLAWSYVQRIESEGGLAAALGSGLVRRAIEESATEEGKQIAKRKLSLIGVSEFANPGEERLVVESRSSKPDADASPIMDIAAAVVAGAGSSAVTEACIHALRSGASVPAVLAGLSANSTAATCRPLRIRRYADSFEALRDRADDHGAPTVFLANYGRIPEHRARSGFAQNFFQAGGFVAEENDGFTEIEPLVAAFRSSGADIAVICSSDANYQSVAADIAGRLKQAGAQQLYLAGRPGDNEKAWRAAGVDDFIYMGSDLISVLDDALTIAGAKGGN